MGGEGPRRRAQEALPGTRQETGCKCPEGSDPGSIGLSPRAAGEEQVSGGPYLVLGVLKHVAHAALVLLEAEEDIPQPQGGQKHHEDIERQVPEVD